MAFTLSPASLGDIPVNEAVSYSLSAAGGNAPVAFAVSAGALPAGLALDPAAGTISGTASAAGAYSFSVTATDASAPAQTVTASFSGNVVGETVASRLAALVGVISADVSEVEGAVAELAQEVGALKEEHAKHAAAASVAVAVSSSDWVDTDLAGLYTSLRAGA